MIDLGLRQPAAGPVTLGGHRSTARGSPCPTLEQLFAKLRRHQLVKSTRGPGGGLPASPKPMESVSVADIIFRGRRAAGDDAGRWRGRSATPNQPFARHMNFWATLNRQMIDFLDSVSLART